MSKKYGTPFRTETVWFTPWVDETYGTVGFRAKHDDGRVEHFYLNASDDEPDVFVYRGSRGDPNDDTPLHYYSLAPEED